MPDITKDLAEDVVRKLRRTPSDPKLKPFTVTCIAGANHDIYKVMYQGMWIGQFGIQRGSKKDVRHNYVAEQLYLTRQQGYNLAKCPLSIDDYIEILQERRLIPEDPTANQRET